MQDVNQKVLEQLSSGSKSLGELKDATKCDYKSLNSAITLLVDEGKIESGWSDDALPAIVYSLKKAGKLCTTNSNYFPIKPALFWR